MASYVGSIVMIVQSFKVKRMLEYDTVEILANVATFFFQNIYLQYWINRNAVSKKVVEMSLD